MTDTHPLRIGFIGAGNIAGPYGMELTADPAVEVMGISDLDPERAQALAGKLNVPAFPSVDALLADPDVDAIVNLTVHRAHAPVSTRILQAGKHAYSEKPMAMTYPEARALVVLAETRGLRLASAPSAFMGEAPQTAWKLVREGRIGRIRAVYAEANWGRIESWHPAPESFYDVGVMPDVGIYPLSLLTTIFGPARRVQAFGTVMLRDRVTKAGYPFRIETPEFVVAVIEMADGTIVRLTANWYIEQQHSKQAGIEFHGDAGSLWLESWLDGSAGVQVADTGKPFESTPPVRIPQQGVVWSRAVPEMARAIREHRPHRASGEHGAHLVEIMDAITESSRTHSPIEVTSTFTPPPPMEWATD